MSGRLPIPGTHEPGFEEQRIVQHALPLGIRSLSPLSRAMKYYSMGECTVLVAREPAGPNGELLWHLTISAPDRHPSWDEIKVARYRLLPGHLCFGMLLPPRDLYVNVPAQDHVFHLWEVTDPREPWSGG